MPPKHFRPISGREVGFKLRRPLLSIHAIHTIFVSRESSLTVRCEQVIWAARSFRTSRAEPSLRSSGTVGERWSRELGGTWRMRRHRFRRCEHPRECGRLARTGSASIGPRPYRSRKQTSHACRASIHTSKSRLECQGISTHPPVLGREPTEPLCTRLFEHPP
jgi:hypothetical protein